MPRREKTKMTDYSNTLAAACCMIDDTKVDAEFLADFRSGTVFTVLHKSPWR
jgi:hypothetical protein